jgi:hypothetical protein
MEGMIRLSELRSYFLIALLQEALKLLLLRSTNFLFGHTN